VPIAWVQLGVLFTGLLSYPLVKEADPDFWWHLRTGELVFHGGIPRDDPFSWTAAGHAWVAHEWLSELLIYGVESMLGYWANVLLFGGVVIAALLLMYRLGRSSGAGTKPLVLLMYLSVATLGLYVTVRPQEFTWLLFAVFVYILQRHYAGERAPLWALPPLMALWANLHLGFVYGLMLVGAWCAALAFDRARGGAADLRGAAVIAAACVVAACLNPHGPALLWYPVRYFFEGQADRQFVREWQHPDIRVIPQQLIFLADALLAGALLLRTRPRPFLFIVTLASVALSLQALRNAPFVALLLLPVAGPAIAARWPSASRAADSRTRVSIALVLAVAIVIAGSVGVVAARRGTSIALGDPSERGYPQGGAAYVRAHEAGKRLFNEYSWGGYLIEVLYPGTPVFIDGRADFYGNRILNDYATIYRTRPGWEELFAHYDPEVVLVAKAAPIAAALRADARWREAFTGERESVFVRAD